MHRLLLPFIIFGLLSGAQEGLGKVRLGTPVKPQPSYDLLLLAAQEKGFWKEQGLEVEWTAFESGETMGRAMVAGAINMGMTASTAAVFGIASRPVEIIVADLGNPDYSEIYTLSTSPIREPKDLKGAKLGVTRLGRLYHHYGAAAAKAIGIEMKYIGVGGQASQLAALKAGAVDAVLMGRGIAFPLALKGEIRKVVVVEDYLPRVWLGNIVLASRDYAGKNPETVSRAIKATFRGIDFLMKNRAWAVERAKAFYGYSEGEASWLYDNILRYEGKDGRIDPRAVENVRNFLVEYGMVPKDKVPPLDVVFTNKFVD